MVDTVLLGLEGLLDEVRTARVAVAEARAYSAAERYPEIELGVIAPLLNAELIREALRRELRHQQQVLRDMGNV